MNYEPSSYFGELALLKS